MHPILPKIVRTVVKDLDVPLSDPVKDRNGRTVDRVVLRRGTRIFVNAVSYNR